MRHILLLLFSLVLIAPFGLIAVMAQPAAPNTAPNADQTQQAPAGKFIQDIGNRAIAVMADKGLAQEQRSQKYREILRDAFDLQTIGHFVLGRSWNTATPEQQQTFMQLFEQIVLETYGDRLNFYSGEGFQVKNVRQESDKDMIVSSEVTHPNGAAATQIDWRVRDRNGKPAVIDVIIAGVSQSVTQRQEYSAIIQRNNGNIEGLLSAMRQRLQGPKQ
jgi:phospholipid transport system substrate-binding protein